MLSRLSQSVVCLSLLGTSLGGAIPAHADDPKLNEALQQIKRAIEESDSGTSKLVAQFSDEQLIEIMTQEGYRGMKVVKEGVISFKMEGVNILLFRISSGDLQLFLGMLGGLGRSKQSTAGTRSIVYRELTCAPAATSCWKAICKPMAD